MAHIFASTQYWTAAAIEAILVTVTAAFGAKGMRRLLLGFIFGVCVAYLLTLIHLEHTIIAGVKDLIKIDIGQSGFFLLMGILGGISRVMIGGFITGLVVAYLFTFINLDHIVIQGLKEWFKYDLSSGGYYLLFAVIGAAASFLGVVRTFLKPVFFIMGRKKQRPDRS